MTNKNWTSDHYAPESLAEFALEDDVREELKAWLENPGHLLLDGPPGTGKTTLAEWLAPKVGVETRCLNASDYGGVDKIRREVIEWGKRLRDGRAVVILDEADYLTSRAQGSLRRPMEAEEWSDLLLVIATTNEAQEELEDPLKSRFSAGTILDVPYPPVSERERVLARVLALAGHDADRGRLREHAKEHADLREMLNAAERSVRRQGCLPDYPGAGAVSRKMRETLTVVSRLIREEGEWPGYEKAAERRGCVKSTMYEHVKECRNLGLMEKDPVRLTEQGRSVLKRGNT